MTSKSVAFALLAAVAVGRPALGAPVTSQFAVTGDVGDPGTTFDLTALQALPPVTQADSFTSAGNPTTDTYTGASIWNVLNAAGGIAVNSAIKNDVLSHYVVATGSDGYTVVYAAGEIDPNFGNRPYLAAYSDTGGQVGNGGGQGFARVTAPGDVAGGRYVSNLQSLSVGQGPIVAGAGGGVSTQLSLSGLVSHAGYYDLAGLQALSPTTLTATYRQGASTTVTDTYTGVSLWSLILSAGLVTNASIKNDVLRYYALITGTDGYSVAVSLGEIDPMFGNQDDLIAYSDTDGQFDAGSGDDGFARLVVPGDLAGGRYVSNIESIQIIDATNAPEPGTLSVLAVAGVALGRLRRRRAG